MRTGRSLWCWSGFLAAACLLCVRDVPAARLRVLSASTISLEPRVSADRATVILRVRAQDDRGVQVGGPLTLSVFSEQGVVTLRRAETLGTAGFAEFSVPIDPWQHVLRVQAEFIGNPETAPARAEARVELDSPFFTLALQAPSVIDADTREAEFIAHLSVGEVVLRSPQGLEVALRMDQQILATGRADPTGRIAFRVPVRVLGVPGVRVFRAEHARAGATVSSPERRVVLRAQSSISLARAVGENGSPEVLGALATRFGVISRAPIRLMEGTRILAAGLTDEQGSFRIGIDDDTAQRPGVVVRATYTPTEPWFAPTESAPLQITATASRSVRWFWLVVPAVFGMLIFFLLRRTATPSPEVQEKQETDQQEGWAVLRATTADTGVFTAKIHVFDAATRNTLPGGIARWEQPTQAECEPNKAIEVKPGERFRVFVALDGYAPRVIEGKIPATGGEFVLRVGLRTWREELFERARRWLRAKSGSGPVLLTPREAVHQRGNDDEQAFAALIEQGSYGEAEPNDETLRVADELARKARAL